MYQGTLSKGIPTEGVPVFGRLDKAELRGSEAPYQEQDDGWEATSILAGIQGGVFSRICG